ncbi:MAG TPA: NYN domain-containing protein, partial [Gemmatimonadales bacterium]|nr:NYN domain-containing protein [Gemmatimonadales bacterium]
MMPQPHAHLARPHKEPPLHAPNAALLIDFDNVTMGIRSDLQTELKRLLQSEIIRGKVAVQRAYADWRRYPQYIVPLSESSIDLIFAPAYGSNKKNATDIRLAIDALELVFTRPEIGTFILLSGDSDFSSLVLKLKEYGKYVIGVGIRESSSDLLIQNCDEYYSYNELAGLTKESDITHERHDPWELVVEAVKQMTAHNDVMRSDRLKQVMQEIDPAFNEKDVGFSRFSKFVVEAAHKGLINLTKLDNGQYEIGLGPGVPGAAAQPIRAASEPAREDRGRESGGRGGRRDDSRGRRGGGFALGDAFGLLRQALARLGGSDKAVRAETVRETMIELKGGDAEPLDAERFPKLLRQAHDAEIIDLSKEADGAYEVRLRGDAAAAAAAPAEPEALPPTPSERESGEAPAAPAAAPLAGIPSRSARFRRGSRGPRVAPPEIPKIGVVEVDPNFKPRIELLPPTPGPLPERPSADRPAPPAAPAEDEDRGGGGGGGRGGRGRGAARGGGGRSGRGPEGGGRAERDHGEPGER